MSELIKLKLIVIFHPIMSIDIQLHSHLEKYVF